MARWVGGPETVYALKLSPIILCGVTPIWSLVICSKVSIYQHQQDVFGWICINSYPIVFLRCWVGVWPYPTAIGDRLGLTTPLCWPKLNQGNHIRCLCIMWVEMVGALSQLVVKTNVAHAHVTAGSFRGYRFHESVQHFAVVIWSCCTSMYDNATPDVHLLHIGKNALFCSKLQVCCSCHSQTKTLGF